MVIRNLLLVCMNDISNDGEGYLKSSEMARSLGAPKDVFIELFNFALGLTVLVLNSPGFGGGDPHQVVVSEC